MIAPFAFHEAACEWQLIGAAVVLTKHLNRLIRRRFSRAVEFGQTSFARCHCMIFRKQVQALGLRSTPVPIPPALAGDFWQNLNARIRFRCGIFEASPLARNKLTVTDAP